MDAWPIAEMLAFALAGATISELFVGWLKRLRVSLFTKLALILAFYTVLGLFVGGLLRLYWLLFD
jgi:hypothetical protein